jgi:tripartite-type tricarboxylate transporter receptor subunit TctC
MKNIILALSFLMGVNLAYAENPNDKQPIRIVVPGAPGGGLDLTARIIGKNLSEIRKVPVVVENRPGGNGIIAARNVVSDAADGKTLLFYSPHFYTINNLFSESQKDIFEWEKELSAISLMHPKPFVVLINKKHNVSNLSELREKFKDKEITFGSTAVGTPVHMYPELIFNKLGIKSIHVTYKSYPQVVTDVLSGTLDSVTGASLSPHIKSGNLIPLFVFSNKSDAEFPKVQTATGEFSEFANLKIVVNFLVHRKTDSSIKDSLMKDLEVATKNSIEELKQRNLIDANEPVTYDDKKMRLIEQNWISAVDKIKNKK